MSPIILPWWWNQADIERNIDKPDQKKQHKVTDDIDMHSSYGGPPKTANKSTMDFIRWLSVSYKRTFSISLNADLVITVWWFDEIKKLIDRSGKPWKLHTKQELLRERKWFVGFNPWPNKILHNYASVIPILVLILQCTFHCSDSLKDNKVKTNVNKLGSLDRREREASIT